MWTIITEQTNLYATQRIENEQLKAKSRLQKWRPVTVEYIEEINRFWIFWQFNI
jgi:hypothetical protein